MMRCFGNMGSISNVDKESGCEHQDEVYKM